MRITYALVALISISIGCGPRAAVGPRPELRPSLQSLTIVQLPEQRYVDGVPVGPLPRTPGRLERRADTLVVRGSIPYRGKWPPTVTLGGTDHLLDASLHWNLFETGSFIQIRAERPREWEMALAPLAPGPWRVRVTQRDSTDTVLGSWTVDTTLD